MDLLRTEEERTCNTVNPLVDLLRTEEERTCNTVNPLVDLLRTEEEHHKGTPFGKANQAIHLFHLFFPFDHFINF